MGNILLSWSNYLARPGTSLSASSEDLPVSNLQQPVIKRRWRTVGGADGSWVRADFGAPVPIGVLAFQQPQDAGGVDASGEAEGWMQPTDTVRHRLGSAVDGDDAYAGAVTAGAWRPGYGTHLTLLPAEVTARHYRLDLAAPSLNPSPGFIDLGYGWAGPAWRPEVNISYENYSFGWVDETQVDQVPSSGIETAELRGRRRVVSFGFGMLSEIEEDDLLEMQRLAGRRALVLFCLDPDHTGRRATKTIIGRMSEINPITNPYFAGYAAAFQVREAL